jgi:hypothetical protein
MYTYEISDVIDSALSLVQNKGSDYRYTDEPLYQDKRRCVNVLFDYEDKYNDAKGGDYPSASTSVRDVSKLDGKKNFRPGCLVGSIVLDITDADMGWFFQHGRNGRASSETIGDLQVDGLGTFSPLAGVFLRELQSIQDAGKTWGEAYASAVQHTLRVYCTSADAYYKPTKGEIRWIQYTFGDHQGPKEDSAAVSS